MSKLRVHPCFGSIMAVKIKPEDTIFSLYIRARDRWSCRRCKRAYRPYEKNGDNSHLSGLHCMHFKGRGNYSVRFDEDNCMSGCYGCHSYLDRNPIEKAEFWLKELGQERFDALVQRSNKVGSRKPAFIKEIKQVYKTKFENVYESFNSSP